MWQTKGHNQAKQLLERQIASGSFSHAYLFAGSRGVGMRTLAQEFTGKILGSATPYTHPDYIFFDAKESNMDSIRAFLPRLAGKPFVGQYKVAIMDNMDEANVQMSNALLKTLEEPSPSTILILIARPNSLLPTIVSRCQIINFNPSTQKSETPDPGPVAELEKAMRGNISDRLLLINQLAELENEQLNEILLAWLHRQRAQLAQEPQRAKIMSRIMEALTSLKGSFNKKMVLQRLLIT